MTYVLSCYADVTHGEAAGDKMVAGDKINAAVT